MLPRAVMTAVGASLNTESTSALLNAVRGEVSFFVFWLRTAEWEDLLVSSSRLWAG